MNSGIVRLDQIMSIFANNEQALLAVITVTTVIINITALCFAHAEQNLIKLKLYNN